MMMYNSSMCLLWNFYHLIQVIFSTIRTWYSIKYTTVSYMVSSTNKYGYGSSMILRIEHIVFMGIDIRLKNAYRPLIGRIFNVYQ